jgi:hypothetical protein
MNPKDINGDIKRNMFGAKIEAAEGHDPNVY